MIGAGQVNKEESVKVEMRKMQLEKRVRTERKKMGNENATEISCQCGK